MRPRTAWGAALAISVVDSALAAAGAQRARRVTKPAVVPAIALAVRSGGGQPSRTLDVALAGSWLGDVALLSRSDAGLLGGVGGFAVAHLAYLKEIRRAGAAHDRTAAGRAAAGAFAGVFAAATPVLWRRLGTPGERRLRAPVVGYAALVTGMGAAATRAGLRRGGAAGRALAVGGATFVVSDGLVALSQFGPRRSRAVEAAVMLTYAAAQGLLAGALSEPVS